MGTAQGEPLRESVSLQSPDLDGLFVDWLSEVLFLFEAREFVPLTAAVKIDGTKLEATLEGVKATSFEQTGPAVKAVTYHGLELSDAEARVYIDV